MGALLPGTVLKDRYAVQRLLAEGGTSYLYQGTPLQGAGLVAIKQLKASANPTEREEDLRHFQAEYRMLRDLRHPGLPRVLEYLEVGDAACIIEEYVPGETLAERINRQGRLAPEEAVEVVLALLDVLEYLHERSIIYRDLKPSNVLQTPTGVLRLVDFGAARRYRLGALHDTVPLGTPGFASPEHYGRAQTDARSDIYCVGALLHAMLTGLDPSESPPWSFDPPHERVPEVPIGLSRITMKALALDPRARFPDAEAFRFALLSLEADEGDALSAEGGSSRLGPVVRKVRFPHRAAYYLNSQTLCLGAFGMLFFAISVPAWLELVPLPHPLVGAWLTAHALMKPNSNWKRLRSMEVDIHEDGMRVDSGGSRTAFRWDEVQRVHLDGTPDFSTGSAEIVTRRARVRIDAAWPGTHDVVWEVIRAAGLSERSPRGGLSGGSAPAPGERVYERDA